MLQKKIKISFVIGLFIGVSLSPTMLITITNASSTNQIYINYYEQTSMSTNQKNYKMVIITPNEFKDLLLPLVDHKNSFGMNTVLKTTEEIYNEYIGFDQAEQIKYYIKDAIEKWDIKYVLLAGGRKGQQKEEKWWVPVRYSYLDRKYGNHIEERFLSDLYFADIYDKYGNFCSWDNDNNGFYGEWPEKESAVDIPDLYPDVCVGRLPFRNKLEVIIVVNKIIKYEKMKSSESWFNKMAVIAGDTYPDKTDYIDGEVYTQQAIDLMPDFKHTKVWASDGSLKNWLSIVKTFNHGYGFIFFSGHGGPHTWGTHPPNDSKIWFNFRIKHMKYLLNVNKLPVILTASGCFITMFNVSLGNTDWVYEYGVAYNIPRCWSWTLIRKPIGGSIAVIGSTAFSYESPDIDSGIGGCEQLDIRFFEQYGQNKKTIIGECWNRSITSFLQNYTINWFDKSNTGDALIAKNCEQWLLMGDPSLKIGGYL